MRIQFERRACIAVLMSMPLWLTTAAMAEEIDISDEAMESFLLNAEVVGIQQMLPGSTYPMAVELESHGTVRRAAYKYRPADLPLTEDTVIGEPLADSYLYEVAAYRIDRELGLGLVPVSVIRDIHAEGALIEWIENAMTEEKLRQAADNQGVPESLARQKAVMILFDALILNKDRKPSDQLVTPEDWRLHLLDHSRSFQVSDEVPEAFLSRPVSLPRALLHRLVQLNTESLTELLDGLVTAAQVEAMLRRRDRILEKIALDREKYGDAVVFQD